jgi:hypothetical protein
MAAAGETAGAGVGAGTMEVVWVVAMAVGQGAG